MGLRVNISLADIVLASKNISLNLRSEVLKGDYDLPDTDPCSRDLVVQVADVTYAPNVTDAVSCTFDVDFGDGSVTLSADFNAWGGNREVIQKILDSTGCSYKVF